MIYSKRFLVLDIDVHISVPRRLGTGKVLGVHSKVSIIAISTTSGISKVKLFRRKAMNRHHQKRGYFRVPASRHCLRYFDLRDGGNSCKTSVRQLGHDFMSKKLAGMMWGVR